MNKFVNEIDNMLDESLSGFGHAHADIIDVHFKPNFITRKIKPKKKKSLLFQVVVLDMNHCTEDLWVWECWMLFVLDKSLARLLPIRWRQLRKILIMEKVYYLS